MNTPWGQSDGIEPLADGILFVTTPSHGGFYVPPELVKNMPYKYLDATFRRQGFNGFFEEDCDWALVALAFPWLFNPEQMDAARRTLKAYKPDLLKP